MKLPKFNSPIEARAAGFDAIPLTFGGIVYISEQGKTILAGGAISGGGVSEERVAEIAQTTTDALAEGIESFDTLRLTAPRFEGERVMLKEYYTSAAIPAIGGGWFTGHLTKQADDGGYIASNGTNYHWRRELPLNKLTIEHFGGIADGVTDCSPAVKKMYEFLMSSFAKKFTNSQSPTLAIRFPAGLIYMSPLDLRKYGSVVPADATDAALYPSGYYAASHIKFSGPETKYGKQIATTIISDKSDNAVIQLNHRFWSMHGITWNGQQTTKQNRYNSTSNTTGTNMLVGATQGVFNDTASNKQPFLVNECPSGCFAQVSCFAAYDTGGATFYFNDSLDSSFDQIYSYRTAAPVIKVGWSDPNNLYVGKWDHSTAIRISNCNFQYPMAPALWIPRHAQGIMENVWFEHGNVPMDINNGQWNISMVSIEDCTKNAICWARRFIIDTFSGPTGNNLDYTTKPTDADWPSYTTNPDGSEVTQWLSTYELGSCRREAYITALDHPFRAKWYSGALRGTNNNATNLWVNIGSFQTQSPGGQWEIEIISRTGFASSGSAPLSLIADRNPGKTILNIQRGSGSVPVCNMYHFGQTGVLAAQYQPQWGNDTIPAVWINFAPYCGEYIINVKGTGVTRLEAGQCCVFTPNGASQIDNPNQYGIENRMSLHNGKAGVGAQGSTVAFQSLRSGNDGVLTDSPVIFMRVNLNGQELALPVYSFVPKFTTDAPATLSVAVGKPLTITCVVTDGVSLQWERQNTEGGWVAIPNATTAKLSIAAAATTDSGNYRLSMHSNDGKGNYSETSPVYYSNITAVTVA